MCSFDGSCLRRRFRRSPSSPHGCSIPLLVQRFCPRFARKPFAAARFAALRDGAQPPQNPRNSALPAGPGRIEHYAQSCSSPSRGVGAREARGTWASCASAVRSRTVKASCTSARGYASSPLLPTMSAPVANVVAACSVRHSWPRGLHAGGRKWQPGNVPGFYALEWNQCENRHHDAAHPHLTIDGRTP